MMDITTKFKSATLPSSPEEAHAMANDREAWAEEARQTDKNGSAREWELTALLLRAWAETKRKESL